MKKKNVSTPAHGDHQENPLQQARIRAGYTQKQTAKALSCDIRTIQRYEAREQFPTQDVLMKMSACYSCEIADLFPKDLST